MAILSWYLFWLSIFVNEKEIIMWEIKALTK